MKASRAAIKTAKAVVTVEERLAAIETRLADVEQGLQYLIMLASADKPSNQGQEAPPKEEPKPRTAYKGKVKHED